MDTTNKNRTSGTMYCVVMLLVPVFGMLCAAVDCYDVEGDFGTQVDEAFAQDKLHDFLGQPANVAVLADGSKVYSYRRK